MVERIRIPRQSTVFNPSPVLITESAEEFERLHDDLSDELKPGGPIERHLVADMAEKVWEVRRLRRVKTSLINSAFRPSLKKLLERLIEPQSKYFDEPQTESGRRADQWFSDERGKKGCFGNTRTIQAR